MESNSEFLTHYNRGRNPIYFAETFLGVRLNPAQKRWFQTALRTRDWWQWVFRRAVHVSGNQTGKTVGLAISILWAGMYKIGLPNDNWDVWLNTEYNWFHIAPSYTQSKLVMRDMQNLMDGTHTAQFDRDTQKFRKSWWPKGYAQETIFDGTYVGFVFLNGTQVHFRSSAEKAKSLQGVRAHGISFDEAAFEQHLIEVIDQAVKLRLISTGGPLWLVSTPNGINDYYEVCQEVLAHSINTFHERVWEAKERKWCLVWSHVSDNIGYGYMQEDVDFLEADIDEATKEQQLRGSFLEPQDAWFVPLAATEAAFVNIPEEVPPHNDRNYAIFWDVSVSNDPTVCIIFDVTKDVWRGVYYRRWEKPMPFRELVSEIRRVHFYYNNPQQYQVGFPPRATTGFDASSMGGVAVRQELSDVFPIQPINMTGSSRIKDNMLIELRQKLQNGKLLLPKSWQRPKRELLSYRRKDDKLVQDCVMALAGAVKIGSMVVPGNVRSKRFDTGHRSLMRR